MTGSRPPVRRVLLVGTGLMGGSVGLALRAAAPEVEIIACDTDPAAARAAVTRGAANSAGDLSDAASADLVLLAVPVASTEAVLAALAPHLRPGTVVTDLGSTKLSAVEAAGRLLPAAASFVGGHPMTGSEEAGIDAARADLFQDAWWVLTPTEATDPAAYRRTLWLVGALGARALALAPAEHDALMATVSHLPQLLASALMRFAVARGEDRAAMLALAAGGFRDMTRIASSRPDIWVDICLENRAAISEALRAFADELRGTAALVSDADPARLETFFREAREARASLPLKAEVAEVAEIRIPVPDRPGVLADVTTALGTLGVNIEDLAITHAAEGGRGVLSLWVRADTDLDAVAGALSRRGLATC